MVPWLGMKGASSKDSANQKRGWGEKQDYVFDDTDEENEIFN